MAASIFLSIVPSGVPCLRLEVAALLLGPFFDVWSSVSSLS
ncbi:MAG: hypothetical protein ACYDGY_10205 [Acidimicrobiales bacterium]